MKALIALFFTGLLTVAPSSEWKIKADGVEIKWEVPAKKHEGTINGLEAKIKFDPENPGTSTFEASVDVASINSNNEKRDNHLRSEDYFDVAKFPKIIFRSNKVEKTADGFNVNGKLEVKETTNEVNIPFTFDKTDSGGVFIGKLELNTDAIGLEGVAGAEGGKANCFVNIKVPVVL